MSAAVACAVVVGLAAVALRSVEVVADGLAGAWHQRLRAPGPFVDALADAAVPWAPATAWTAWVATLAVGVVAALLAGGVGLAVVATLVLVGAPLLALSCRRGRAARLVDDALPDVLDGVARSLRSGATLAHAMREAASSTPGPLGVDLRVVVAEIDAGQPLVAAIDGWSARCPTAGVRLATAALSLSAETGGGAARAVDGVAATLRANLAVAGELRAQSSQARLSGAVIALSPLAFAVVAMSTDPRTGEFLLRTPVGLACLFAGVLLDAVAAWWMQRITAAVT